MISVANPYNIEQVGFFNSRGNMRGIDVSDDGLIYVADGTNMSIYRFTDPNAVNDPNITIPAKYKLYSAYPNPFNATTTINYSLPHSSTIQLKIFNTNGRLIDVLQDRVMPAGQHSVIWDAGDVTTGVYLVKLIPEGGSINDNTQKLVLLR